MALCLATFLPYDLPTKLTRMMAFFANIQSRFGSVQVNWTNKSHQMRQQNYINLLWF